MNTSTGALHYLTLEEMQKIAAASKPAQKPQFIAVPQEDVKKVTKMNHSRRKSWMRNQPCPCGSGRKFKKCCWSLPEVTMGERSF